MIKLEALEGGCNRGVGTSSAGAAAADGFSRSASCYELPNCQDDRSGVGGGSVVQTPGAETHSGDGGSTPKRSARKRNVKLSSRLSPPPRL